MHNYKVSGCSDVGHGFNCLNYVCIGECMRIAIIANMCWGECATERASSPYPRACSRTLSARIAESAACII